MATLYPPGPDGVADDLTAPGPTYKRRAQVAFLSLLLFIALYLSLTGWFAWTAYKYFHNAMASDQSAVLGYALGAVAAFLTVFLIKALFFVNRGGEVNDMEVTREQQPGLFEFLYKLADEAGAPRPHRVFLSGRVNAAVFYDLTFLNLIIPSKKNLEIGLALVNGLNLGELKAVLAHEFGHFTQGSMAVGRWVYVAQQIATHIIHQRDILDRFLMGVSNFDIRIAWVGWILRIIVWALRAILDTAFSLVVIAQRSLSREMEFHADLVSVSLTGSDALVHALHRLHAADDAWNRALGVASDELVAGRAVTDIFVIQKIITQRMKEILDDENYDAPPAIPDTNCESHRVFAKNEVHPPQMWSTHPPNEAREENAKKNYISAAIDERPAWDIFRNAQSLREDMTKHILSASPDADKLPKSALTETVANVNQAYAKAMYDRRYRGMYMGRSCVREFESADELFVEGMVSGDHVAAYDALYPRTLPDRIEHWRNVEEERTNLRALYDGQLTSPDGIIRHRGVIMKRRKLPAVIRELREECDEARRELCMHDKMVRSVNNAAAKHLGNGWPEHHRGLVNLLHYADHSEANLTDIHGRLANLWSVVIADGKVSSGEIKELLVVAHDLYFVLLGIANGVRDVTLGGDVAERLGVDDWQTILSEEFTLPEPNRENLGDWLGAGENWIGYFQAALSRLRFETTEAMLASEARIEAAVRGGANPGAAPAAARVPQAYATLLPNTERKLQTRLGAWDRFQTADGFFPGLARFGVAAAIVGGLLGVGVYTSGSASVTIYNGLAAEVRVVADGDTVVVNPRSTATFSPVANSELMLNAYAEDGLLIESVRVDSSNSLAEYVYNVAGAAPIIEWTAVYGGTQDRPPVYLGSQEWFQTDADHIFTEPPDEIRSSNDGGSRQVLTAFADIDPSYLSDYLPPGDSPDKIVRAHATWDNPNADTAMLWMVSASEQDYFDDVIQFRLSRDDDEILARRFEQDTALDADEAQQICQEHTTSAQQQPGNLDWQYLALRCLDDSREKSAAFIKAYEQAPRHAWFAGAAGYSYAEAGKWALADDALMNAYNRLPAMRPSYSDTLVRIRRLTTGIDAADIGRFQADSAWLELNLLLETRTPMESPAVAAYQLLAQGQLLEAVDEAAAIDVQPTEVLRLAAASDGAPASLLAAASALEADQGLDSNTMWSALGLAAAHGQSADALLADIDLILGVNAPLARELFAAVSQRSVDTASVETLFAETGPSIRGQAYTMAAVALGEEAPQHWRTNARRLLFVTERPYFEPE
jgi:Zn-dependent protease with chaperone function